MTRDEKQFAFAQSAVDDLRRIVHNDTDISIRRYDEDMCP